MAKIMHGTEEITSESLNAQFILDENERKANENNRNIYEAYNNGKTYYRGNKVTYNGSSFVCLKTCTGILPTSSTEYWLCIAAAGGSVTDASQLLISDTGNYYTVDDTNSALQEAGQRIGDLSQLTTTSNTDLVGAVNENVLNISEITYKASLNNVNPSTSLDMTSTLNTFFTNIKAKGAKYVHLDKTGKYRVDGILDDAKDLILFGDSEIEKNTFDNYYINIAKTIRSYQGKINSYGSEFNQFQQFRKALSENRYINVCFFTDSMGSGSDAIGVKYNNGGIGYSETSPNGLTSGDSYYYQFIDMITKTFPDKTFNFYNRGIGGTLLSEWDATKTFDSATKTWIEHIKDTNADLLVIGFGMNHSWYASSVQIAYEIKDVTDYIAANFTTKPDLAWVTSPRPVLSKDGAYGDNTRQFSVDNAAQSVRSYAKEIGGYIIDAGKLSNIKRTGKSYLNPYFKSYATTESEIDAIANGTYTKSGSNYVMNAQNEYINFYDYIMKDFVIEFNASFSSFSSSDDCLAVYYNQVDDAGTENTIFILPNAIGNSGNGQIKNYGEIGDSRWGGLYSIYNAGAPFTSIKIKIEKREDIVDIYVDDIRVIRDSLFTLNNAGNIKLVCFTSTGTISLSNIKLYKGEYETYLPELTETDMWGTYTTATDTDTKLPIGGNGVNHPSNIAISEVYVPVLQECIEDIQLSLKIPTNGSNANGSYVLLPDGTAMFHTKRQLTGSGLSWYGETGVTMPIAINDCVLHITAYNSQATYTADGTASTTGFATSTTEYRYGVKFPVSVDSSNIIIINISGIGKWK